MRRTYTLIIVVIIYVVMYIVITLLIIVVVRRVITIYDMVVIAVGGGEVWTGIRCIYCREWVLVKYITRRRAADIFQRGGDFNFYFNALF